MLYLGEVMSVDRKNRGWHRDAYWVTTNGLLHLDADRADLVPLTESEARARLMT